jgi:hypothetical protein
MVSEDEASSLGVRVGLVRNTLLATASLITGTAVAFSGAIVFVGLVVPHTLRPISGADKSLLVSLAPWAAECSYWLRQAGPQQDAGLQVATAVALLEARNQAPKRARSNPTISQVT